MTHINNKHHASKMGHGMKFFFHNACQILLYNFNHDQNFIKKQCYDSLWQKSQKVAFSAFPENTHVKAILQKHG